MDNTYEILVRAGDLVALGWTQEAYARDTFGEPTTSTSREAVCWCTLGALELAATELAGEDNYSSFYQARNVLATHVGTWSLASFNDSSNTKQEDVETAFREAASAYRDDPLSLSLP